MPKSVYLIAGETSGDVLGGRLLYALKQMEEVTIHGIGGSMMCEQGLDSLFPMEDLSVMGVFEILPRLPKLIRRVHQTVDDIVDKQPDIVVTIDSPDFCKPVVKRAKKRCPNTKFIHYVAPTVWAWRAGRAKKMAHLFDGLICLLPFEPPYFERHGLRAQFCGHPVVETIMPGDNVREGQSILILPGSRKGEVARMAPVFADVFRELKSINPDLKGHIVALDHVKGEISEAFWGMDVDYVLPEERYKSFQTVPLALATSGTVGLELAVAECPHIIAYKMNPLTWWLLKRLVKVRYAHLVNIMEDQEVIPECLQADCTKDGIMNAIRTYNEPDLGQVRTKLAGSDPNMPPSAQAATFVLSYLK